VRKHPAPSSRQDHGSVEGGRVERPLGQKIEAIEGIVPARHSLVGRCAAIGLMQLRIADLAISVLGCLRITLAKTVEA
jgi:hypothetical protein